MTTNRTDLRELARAILATTDSEAELLEHINTLSLDFAEALNGLRLFAEAIDAVGPQPLSRLDRKTAAALVDAYRHARTILDEHTPPATPTQGEQTP